MAVRIGIPIYNLKMSRSGFLRFVHHVFRRALVGQAIRIRLSEETVQTLPQTAAGGDPT